MATFPPNPSWLGIYGFVPSYHLDDSTGILYKGLLSYDTRGTQEQQKASFHYRVFGWGATAMIEYPLEVEVFQAALTVIRGLLFVGGLGVRGECLQQIPGVGPRLLAVDDLPFTDTAQSYAARPVIDAGLRDRLWRGRAK